MSSGEKNNGFPKAKAVILCMRLEKLVKYTTGSRPEGLRNEYACLAIEHSELDPVGGGLDVLSPFLSPLQNDSVTLYKLNVVVLNPANGILFEMRCIVRLRRQC